MRQNKLALIFLFSTICLLPFAGAGRAVLAQETARTSIPVDSLLAAAFNIFDSTPYCTLVTLDESGSPRIRPMDPFPPDSNMAIRLGTDRYSRKVTDIQHNPEVALCYLAPGGIGYVSVYGKAQLVDTPEARAKWWKPSWAGLYADKDKDYIVIKVVPEKIEVINYALGVKGDPQTWLAPTISFKR